MLGKTFSTVQAAIEEQRTDPAYRWDNAFRTDGKAMVVQRTISGTGFVEDRSGRQLVKAGWAMLFAHNEPSRYGFPPEAAEPYRLQFIAFSPAATASELFRQLRHDFGAVVRLPEESEACAVFGEIMKRFKARTFRDRYHETELLVRLLVALYREQVENTRMSDPIEFGFHYLHNRFSQPINLKLVADKCGVSREHFVREFTKRYGAPPGAALRKLRLEHARAMLNATTIPVEEVALASGFASADTFCRAFRRAFGASPARSRRDR